MLKCLRCGKNYSVDVIDLERQCPNCGCIDFNVELEEIEQKEATKDE
jgi:predicted  nucleic acid-binding Zn-ribbon protein